MVPYSIRLCYIMEWEEANNGQVVGCSEDQPCSQYQDGQYTCDTYTGWYDDGGGGGGGADDGSNGGAGDASGNTGGGGGGYTNPTQPPAPCVPTAYEPRKSAQAKPAPPCDNGGTGWEPVPARDANGYLYDRVIELDNLLQQDPSALIDCSQLSRFESFGMMWQRVAQFTPSVSIINRIEALEQATTYDLTNDFYMQTLENATGSIVNCDFYAVRIQQLPTGMTADGLLEYFRKNINSFITAPLTSSFTPYKDNANIDDTQLFNNPFESSLGALVSIKLNLLEDGSVVLSDYYRNFSTNNQKHRFTFSTIATPLDFAHPVSGNREFGIYNPPTSPNELCFYIMGVDRASGGVYSQFENSIFAGGDALWSNIQINFKNYINNSGGQASLYPDGKITARPPWADVKDYLKGNISLQTLKYRLGC